MRTGVIWARSACALAASASTQTPSGDLALSPLSCRSCIARNQLTQVGAGGALPPDTSPDCR